MLTNYSVFVAEVYEHLSTCLAGSHLGFSRTRPVSRDTPKYTLLHTSQLYISPLKQSSVNQTKLETVFFNE